jgi:cysteinyl-tRNA synthetase
MKLYNTLTEQLEPVTPGADNTFRMYVCGVTPYDTTHLGHAFTFMMFDALARYLEFKGYNTITVQNVTDIDDDILKRAAQVGMAWDQLANEETAKYQEDMRMLNVRPPDHYPRATGEIPRIIEMVSNLLAKGYAYEKNGSVYYDVRHDPDFGALGHMDYANMLATANERGNFPDDPNKRDPLDFVLWQAAQPGEPTWDSPWGAGRPGWHIECSAMSMHYLGDQVDIHSGGADLIFPHHTCEIAQSEHTSGVKPFVRYWFHVAMVRLDGEKMSKSLGNMLFVRKLLQRYSVNALRVYLLSHKYRDVWDADNYEADLAEIEGTLAEWNAALSIQSTEIEPFDPSDYEQAFIAALDDDFDTPRAVKVLNRFAMDIRGRADADVSRAQAVFRDLCEVFGLVLA